MEISLALQSGVFLYSIIFGIILDMSYFFLRIIRIILPKSIILTIIFDILFFIASAFSTFIFLLIFNKGEIRLYYLFGIFTGAFLIHITLNNFLYKKIYKTAVKFKLKIIELYTQVKINFNKKMIVINAKSYFKNKKSKKNKKNRKKTGKIQKRSFNFYKKDIQ